MTRLSCSISLLAVMSGVPTASAATPVAVTTLPTAAIATEPGVAEAIAPPPGGTTEVSVAVTTSPAPTAVAPAPAPAPEAAPPPSPRVDAPQPRPAPPPPPTPQELFERERHEQVRHDRKSGRGLLAAGLTVAGTAYLFTSLSGALAIDRAGDLTDDPTTERDESLAAGQRRRFGRALLIPGIGPALAINRADTAIRAWAAGMAGLTQGLGAALSIIGIHRLARARRLERLQFSAMGTARQAQVSLRVRF